MKHDNLQMQRFENNGFPKRNDLTAKKNQTAGFMPFDVSLEKELLANMLAYPACLADAVEGGVTREWFFDAACSVTFEAMRSFFDNGEALSSTLLSRKLVIFNQKEGIFQDSADLYNFIGEIQTIGQKDLFQAHLSVLNEYHKRRQAIEYAQNLIQQAKNLDEPIFQAIDQTSLNLSRISESLTEREGHLKSAKESAEEFLADFIKKREGQEQSQGYIPAFLLSGFFPSGYKKPDLILLAGRPGHGKTALAIAEGLLMAESGCCVAFGSFEMSRQQVVNRIIANLSGVDFKKIELADAACEKRKLDRDKLLRDPAISEEKKAELRSKVFTPNYDPQDAALIEAAALRFASFQHNFFIFDKNMNYGELRLIVAKLKKRYNLQFLIVDYLQLMENMPHINKNDKTGVANDNADGLKMIAKRYDIPVLALSQMTREIEKSGRHWRDVRQSDIRDGGEQPADSIIFVSRPENFGETQDEGGVSLTGRTFLACRKFRNGQIGDDWLDHESALYRYSKPNF